MRCYSIFIFIASCCFLSSSLVDNVEEVTAQLQEKYDTLESFSATFTQILINKALNQTREEGGVLYIKRAGMMRWEYQYPEEKLFISDGRTIYWYLREEKMVQTLKLEDMEEEQTPLLFLAGKGNLKRDFIIEPSPPGSTAPQGSYQLVLTPRRGRESYQKLILEVDAQSYQVRRMVLLDLIGNITEYRFSNIKENLNLPERFFQFKVPRGVEVYPLRQVPAIR